jgi:hypothetical protein
MAAIHRRMGLKPAGEMVRLVYPLRVDRLVAEALPSGPLATALRHAGNRVLAFREAVRRRDPSVRINLRGPEFETDVEPGIESGGGVLVEHSAAYLNWRYRADPRQAASVLSARRGEGEKESFLVFRRSEEALHIWDAFGVEDLGILRELILEAVDIARASGAAAVTVGMSDRHPFIRVFEKVGFHRRASAPFFAYVRPGVFEENVPWFLMDGDRD